MNAASHTQGRFSVRTFRQRRWYVTYLPAIVGRAGRAFWRPRIWHKLAAIGLAFTLPLGVATVLLAVENGQRMEFSENELRGLAYLRPLTALLVDVAKHKTLSRQVLTGERPGGDMTGYEARVDADLAALHDVDSRLGRHLRTTADQLDNAATVDGLVSSWRALRAAEPLTAINDAAHDRLTIQVRKLIGYVGITSNLLLDPQLDTYHVADAYAVQVPELTDQVRQLGDMMDRLLAGGRFTFADKTRVAAAAALLDVHADALHDDLFTVFAGASGPARTDPLQAALGPLLQSAYRAVADFRALTTRDFVYESTVTLDRSAYARARDTATDAMSALSTALEYQESRLLTLRQAGTAHERTLGLVSVLAALIVAILLTTWLSRRITRAAGAVSRDATELAAGDLARRTPVHGGDEMGALAQAFNSMAERLQHMVEEQQASQRTLRAERDFVDAVVNVAGSLVLVLDRAGRIVRFNRAGEVTTGYAFAEVDGQPVGALFAPAGEASGMTGVVDRPADDFPIYFEDRLVTRDGRHRHIAWANAALVDGGGAVTHVIATGIDVTARRAAETELREAQERFRLAFDNAPIGMCLTGTDGRFMQVNRALCEMLGYPEPELLQLSVQDITHADDLAASTKAIVDMATGASTAYHAEKRYHHADGHVLWALISASTVHGPGASLYYVTQIQDITERRAAEQQLVHQAMHDPLTHLPNRVLLMDRLEVELGRTRGRSAGLAVIFVDLDGFKAINDGLGHDAGDQVLVEVADRLRRQVRPGDTIARLAGDEFVILCADLSSGATGSVVQLGERLTQVVASPIMIDANEVVVTASIGIALTTAAPATAEEMIRNADRAMYHAKARGKNRYEVFDETLREHITTRVSVAQSLRRGLRDERFRLYFQPVVDVASATPVGVEALLRLDDAEQGLVAPDSFIEAAEETGLIVPVGSWVMANACRQLADWRRSGVAPEGLHVAVNLSVRQATRPDLTDTVALALLDAGLPPQALALEVTESVLIEADAAMVRQLERIRDMGVRLGIDDFGTGYSSLTYLKKLPVSFVKIDRSFVSGLVHDPSDREIVTAVIRLGQALGLVTVAEGVEDLAQLAILGDLGCDQAQGYLFGRPSPGPPTGGVAPAPRSGSHPTAVPSSLSSGE